MARKNDYIDDDLIMQTGVWSGAAGGILRVTLLFGSAALALALIIAPLANRSSQAVVDYSAGRSLDEIQTGSIKKADPTVFTAGSGALQSMPNSICARQNRLNPGHC
jgi:hypothetical protein